MRKLISLCIMTLGVSGNLHSQSGGESFDPVEVTHYMASNIGAAKAYAELCDNLELDTQEVDSVAQGTERIIEDFGGQPLDSLVARYQQDILLDPFPSDLSKEQACEIIAYNIIDSEESEILALLLTVSPSLSSTLNSKSEQLWVYQTPRNEIYEAAIDALATALAHADFCNELDLIDPADFGVFFDALEKHSPQEIADDFYERVDSLRFIVGSLLSLSREQSVCQDGIREFTQQDQGSVNPVLLKIVPRTVPLADETSKKWFEYIEMAPELYYEDGVAFFGEANAYADLCSELRMINSDQLANFFDEIQDLSERKVDSGFFDMAQLEYEFERSNLSRMSESDVCEAGRVRYTQQEGYLTYPVLLENVENPLENENYDWIKHSNWVERIEIGTPNEVRDRYYALAMFIMLNCDSLDINLVDYGLINLIPKGDSDFGRIQNLDALYSRGMQNWREEEICALGEELFVSDDGPHPGVLMKTGG